MIKFDAVRPRGSGYRGEYRTAVAAEYAFSSERAWLCRTGVRSVYRYVTGKTGTPPRSVRFKFTRYRRPGAKAITFGGISGGSLHYGNQWQYLVRAVRRTHGIKIGRYYLSVENAA